VRVGGEEDDRRAISSGPGPQEPCGLIPVQVRHLHVEDDDRELLILGERESLGAGGRLDQAKLQPVQHGREREEVVGVVVDEQHARSRRRIVRDHDLGFVPAGSGVGATRHEIARSNRRCTVDLLAR
jgi:hypothetical protein